MIFKIIFIILGLISLVGFGFCVYNVIKPKEWRDRFLGVGMGICYGILIYLTIFILTLIK